MGAQLFTTSTTKQVLTLIQGHIILALRQIPSDFIDCIITSPPYWGLRDYGEETVTIWDVESEEGCGHEWGNSDIEHDNLRYRGATSIVGNEKNEAIHQGKQESGGQFCQKCGAWRGQLGLEPTLDLYLSHLWQITDELYRVLKPSGVMFWNHGDSYGGSGGSGGDYNEGGLREGQPKVGKSGIGIAPKCLAMQNYRFLLGLVDTDWRILVEWRAMGRAEGNLEAMLQHPRIRTILRNQVIWNKPNHMPSSAKDRFTNSYGPIFMLTKNKKYWFDLDAVREPFTAPLNRWGGNNVKIPENTKWNDAREKERWQMSIRDSESRPNPSGKNPGDVWTLPTSPFPEAHFAVFPEAIPERTIKCSCPKEICTECGKARVRITEPSERYQDLLGKSWHPHLDDEKRGNSRKGLGHLEGVTAEYETIGWTTCNCNAEFRPGIVLDPFLGSGTTMKVARRLGMSCIGIEINPKYVEMVKKEVGWNEGLFSIKFDELTIP